MFSCLAPYDSTLHVRSDIEELLFGEKPPVYDFMGSTRSIQVHSNVRQPISFAILVTSIEHQQTPRIPQRATISLSTYIQLRYPLVAPGHLPPPGGLFFPLSSPTNYSSGLCETFSTWTRPGSNWSNCSPRSSTSVITSSSVADWGPRSALIRISVEIGSSSSMMWALFAA